MLKQKKEYVKKGVLLMMERILKITNIIVFINAMLQLALSQVHIGVITKLFALEVGFYLFLFILFGLVTAINFFYVKRNKNNLLLIFSSLAAILSGIKYINLLLNDYKTHESILYSDIQSSLYLTIGGIIIYAFGIVIVLISRLKANK